MGILPAVRAPMYSKRFQYTVLLSLFLSTLALYLVHTTPATYLDASSYLDVASNVLFRKPGRRPFPQKIWQIWRTSIQQFEDVYKDLSTTWITRNPNHRYELVTESAAYTFVRQRFPKDPEIQDTMDRITDHILRVDFLRYLILLAEGGVYTDLDTICTESIREWVPRHLEKKTNMVIGIEWDQRDGDMDDTMVGPVQFCQWTMMAKPYHILMETVVQRVMHRLNLLSTGPNRKIEAATRFDVLNTTGPFVFTTAVYDVLSHVTGTEVTWKNLTMLEKPLLFGDILILPVQKFGGFGSEENGYEGQYVQHYWKGTWKGDHDDDLQQHREDEKKDEEENKSEDDEKLEEYQGEQETEQMEDGDQQKLDEMEEDKAEEGG